LKGSWKKQGHEQKLVEKGGPRWRRYSIRLKWKKSIGRCNFDDNDDQHNQHSYGITIGSYFTEPKKNEKNRSTGAVPCGTSNWSRNGKMKRKHSFSLVVSRIKILMLIELIVEIRSSRIFFWENQNHCTANMFLMPVWANQFLFTSIIYLCIRCSWKIISHFGFLCF